MSQSKSRRILIKILKLSKTFQQKNKESLTKNVTKSKNDKPVKNAK
jgi:hypothetical protein